jgi:hypothetical protein
LPLLELVGHPHVVNPDRALRRAAQSRGWPVLTFSHCGVPSRGDGRHGPVMEADGAGGPEGTNAPTSLESDPATPGM